MNLKRFNKKTSEVIAVVILTVLVALNFIFGWFIVESFKYVVAQYLS